MSSRLHIAALAGFAAVSLASAPVRAATAAEGLWSVNGKAEIAISECGESLCGRLVSARRIEENPDILDKKNRNPALRQRKVKGLPILTGFTGGPTEWKNGSIYNPDDGGTYNATLKMIDADTIKVAGCIVWPLCKSTKLVRLTEEESAKASSLTLANRGD